jgi:hypothetical protein
VHYGVVCKMISHKTWHKKFLPTHSLKFYAKVYVVLSVSCLVDGKRMEGRSCFLNFCSQKVSRPTANNKIQGTKLVVLITDVKNTVIREIKTKDACFLVC